MKRNIELPTRSFNDWRLSGADRSQNIRERKMGVIMYQVIATVFAFGALSACDTGTTPGNENSTTSDPQDNNVEIFEVAGQRAYCERQVPKKCLQVKRKKDKDYKLFHDEIENFEFIPGYIYKLEVEVERLKVIPKDTSGYKYYLKQILKREKVENPDPTAILYLHKWILLRMEGKEIKESRPHLIFERNRKSVRGFSGCNRLGGKFEINDESIGFSRMRQTKRACPNMKEVEFPFTSALQNADTFKVETDRLYFYKGEKILLEFGPAK